MSESSYKKKRKLARQYFVFNMMSGKDIADLLQVTEKTVSAWRQADNWDKERDEVMVNPNEVRRILLRELRHLAEGGDSRIDTDALSKVNKVLDSVSDKLSPQLVTAVIQDLDNFQAERNPVLANQSLELHKEYIRHIISLHD